MYFRAWAQSMQRLTKCLQINGIHNSIEKKELSEGRQCVSNADPRGNRVPTQEKEEEEEKEEKETEEKEATSLMKKRINPPLLKLELKKAYEFSPGSGLWGGNLPCARYQKSYMLPFLFFYEVCFCTSWKAKEEKWCNGRDTINLCYLHALFHGSSTNPKDRHTQRHPHENCCCQHQQL